MYLVSTNKALHQLSNQRHQFSPRQRTVLLLANGQRSLDELHMLIGENVQADVQKLQAQGLLAVMNAGEPLPDDPPNQSAAADSGRLAALGANTRSYLLKMASSPKAPVTKIA